MNAMIQLRFVRLIPILLFLAAAHFLVDVMLGIWPLYKSMAQLDLAKAGLVVALGAFIGEGSQFIFGSLSDRGYRKQLIVIGLIVAMAGSFFAYSTDYLVLFLLYLLTSIGSGCFHPCAASFASSLTSSRKGFFMTIFASGGYLGMATSQLIFSHTYRGFDGQTFILALPAVALGLFFLFYRLPEEMKQIPIDKKDGGSTLKDFKEFFQKPSLLALYLSQVANQSLLWGLIFILPDALKSLGHGEWMCCGGGHFCFVMGAACMLIPGGYLADLFSVRVVMLYGGFISIVCYYGFLFSQGMPNWFVVTVLFFLGSTLALMNPLAVSMGTRMEPTRSGAVSAFLMGLVWCVSETIGPGGLGLMSSLFGEGGSIKALAILGCLFFVQIYATFCLPKRREACASPHS